MYVTTLHNEPVLLHQIAQGDQDAFRCFFDHYTPLLYTFVLRLTKSRSDAEEIVQDTFLKIWNHRESLPFIEKPGRYCYVIARNQALDHLRKAARDQHLLDQVWNRIAGEEDHSLEQELQAREYNRLIDEALHELPEQKQLVFQLSRREGLSQLEIAEKLGLSKSRINNILVEVLQYVRTFLRQHSRLMALVFWITAWERLFK